MRAKDLILSDAISVAIKAEKDILKLKGIIGVLVLALVASMIARKHD